jgi:hypothetical protein
MAIKQNITLSIDEETKNILKEEAKRRNMSIKKVGEEYFHLMIELEMAKRQRKAKEL